MLSRRRFFGAALVAIAAVPAMLKGRRNAALPMIHGVSTAKLKPMNGMTVLDCTQVGVDLYTDKPTLIPNTWTPEMDFAYRRMESSFLLPDDYDPNKKYSAVWQNGHWRVNKCVKC